MEALAKLCPNRTPVLPPPGNSAEKLSHMKMPVGQVARIMQHAGADRGTFSVEFNQKTIA